MGAAGPGLGGARREHPGVGGPRPGLPNPAAPGPPRNFPSGDPGSGAAPGKRAALSRVLTAEWPARSGVSATSGRPLEEGPRALRSPRAERIEARARERTGERFGEGLRGGFLRLSLGPSHFGGLGVFAETAEPSATLVSKSSNWEGGNSEGGREEGALEDLSCPAHLSAPAQMTQFLGP